MRGWALAIFAAGLSVAPAGAQQQTQQFILFGAPTPEKLKGDLPADADPYYSTPQASDKDVDMKTASRREIVDPDLERLERRPTLE